MIAAAEALARRYASSRLFVNFYQPSFQLAEKKRNDRLWNRPTRPIAVLELMAFGRSELVVRQLVVRQLTVRLV